MYEPPLPPSSKDWQSPEFGEAIRIILDVHASLGMPQQEVQRRMTRLGKLVREQPELAVGPFFALINASLGLPALLPSGSADAPAEIRDQLERKVYADIDRMPPPSTDR
jgi:hypothetical protein